MNVFEKLVLFVVGIITLGALIISPLFWMIVSWVAVFALTVILPWFLVVAFIMGGMKLLKI